MSLEIYLKWKIPWANTSQSSVVDFSWTSKDNRLSASVNRIFWRIRKNHSDILFPNEINSEDAIAFFASNVEKICIQEKDQNDMDLMNSFLIELQKEFYNGQTSLSQDAWDRLRSTDFFLKSIHAYVKKSLNNIFSSYATSEVFNEISYCLFLLWVPEKIDIIADIQNAANTEISRFIADIHNQITAKANNYLTLLSGCDPQTSEENKILTKNKKELGGLIESFGQLMEVLNRTISIHEIEGTGRPQALRLSRMANQYLEHLLRFFETSNFYPEEISSLYLTLGKFLIGHSHIDSFDECKTIDDIRTKGHQIIHDIDRGLAMMPVNVHTVAYSVANGNKAYTCLLMLEKMVEIDAIKKEKAVLRKNDHLQILHNIYYGADFSREEFFNHTSTKEVIENFINQNHGVDRTRLEVIHHLVLFDHGIHSEVLTKLVESLAKEDPYKNIYHEKYRVKIFSVILRTLANNEDAKVEVGDVIAKYLENAIGQYSPINEHAYTYLTLAKFYISRIKNNPELNTRELRRRAKLAYLHYSHLNGNDQFEEEKRTELFPVEIQEEADSVINHNEILDFEELHLSKTHEEFRNEFMKMADEIDSKKYEDFSEESTLCSREKIEFSIRRFLYNIPFIRETFCPSWKATDVSCRNCEKYKECKPIARGFNEKKIPYGQNNRHILLTYPANMEDALDRILRTREECIRECLSILDRAFTNNRNHRIAQEKEEKSRQTSQVSGLPNRIACEYYLQILKKSGLKESFILVRIVNYDDFQDEAIRAFARERIEFFANKHQLNVFHVRTEEFVFALGENASREKVEEVARTMLREFSAFSHSIRDIRRIPVIKISGITDNSDINIKLHRALDFTDLSISIPSDEAIQRAIQGETSVGDNISAMREMINHAIDNDRITPYYQEIVATNGKIGPRKYESLMRIFDEEGDMMNLADTLFVAEKYPELIRKMTMRMLEKTCLELGRNTNADFSVNLPPKLLIQKDFIHAFIEKVRSFNIQNIENRIIIEVVEKPLKKKSDDDIMIQHLRIFSENGFRIAIDDYGQEAAGPKRVNEVDAHFVKLDQEFADSLQKAIDAATPEIVKTFDEVRGNINIRIRDLRSQNIPITADIFKTDEVLRKRFDPQLTNLFNATVAIDKRVEEFHLSGRIVIAEHVETEEVAKRLSDLGVDFLQGYLYSKPIPFSKFHKK